MATMQAPAFKENAAASLQDQHLKSAMEGLKGGMISRRQEMVDGLAEFEDLRERGREIKDHVLAHLDLYLEEFADRCEAAGGHVHWCSTAEDARSAILKICRDAGAKTVTKGKSMIAEEIHLNQFFEENDIQPVETDLGEYIVQLAEEVPSHIIAPAIHKTKDQVSDLFQHHHRETNAGIRLTEPHDLINEAREILRDKYFAAEVGITGANFLVAETGTSVIVTNEGNGDLTQSLAKVHIVVTSIEKVVPTLDDMSVFLRLLARSATGQEFSAYTTLSTGPKRPGDPDGPESYHVILLDNGRTSMLGSEFQEMLRCIRCGACMNHCPVYQSVGGHAYGAVYVGPMGSVLSPSLFGLEYARHLPNASTFCGRCESVCPVKIPLPKMMRLWRDRDHEQKLSPATERFGLGVWAWLVKRPALYHMVTSIAMWCLAKYSGKRGYLSKLPLAKGWTQSRELAAPEGPTFRQMWKQKKRKLA